MKAFLDTSSLIKLYHQEEGSDFVMKVLSNDVKEIFLSEIAENDIVALFQAVKARLVKFVGGGTGRADKDIETAIKQIVDGALSSDQVIDIFGSIIRMNP